jgi:hypothetical protein
VDWRSEGAESLLVKPMNTKDLLHQIETLLATHHDRTLEEVRPKVVKDTEHAKGRGRKVV